MIKYHCSKCGYTTKRLWKLREHHMRNHRNRIGESPRLEGIPPKELQYSFYNSPKELVLDLGDYKIRIERSIK